MMEQDFTFEVTTFHFFVSLFIFVDDSLFKLSIFIKWHMNLSLGNNMSISFPVCAGTEYQVCSGQSLADFERSDGMGH